MSLISSWYQSRVPLRSKLFFFIRYHLLHLQMSKWSKSFISSLNRFSKLLISSVFWTSIEADVNHQSLISLNKADSSVILIRLAWTCFPLNFNLLGLKTPAIFLAILMHLFLADLKLSLNEVCMNKSHSSSVNWSSLQV